MATYTSMGNSEGSQTLGALAVALLRGWSFCFSLGREFSFWSEGYLVLVGVLANLINTFALGCHDIQWQSNAKVLKKQQCNGWSYSPNHPTLGELDCVLVHLSPSLA